MKRAGIEAHWSVVDRIARASPRLFSSTSRPESEPSSGSAILAWNFFPGRSEKNGWCAPNCFTWTGTIAAAAATAARWARQAKIPVTADLDNLYPGVEALLENVDYAITSREFPARLSGEDDLFLSLPQTCFTVRVPAHGGDVGRGRRAGVGRREVPLLPCFRDQAGRHYRRRRYFSRRVRLRTGAWLPTSGTSRILLGGGGTILPRVRRARRDCSGEED